jgi:hypothetical protein
MSPLTFEAVAEDDRELERRRDAQLVRRAWLRGRLKRVAADLRLFQAIERHTSLRGARVRDAQWERMVMLWGEAEQLLERDHEQAHVEAGLILADLEAMLTRVHASFAQSFALIRLRPSVLSRPRLHRARRRQHRAHRRPTSRAPDPSRPRRRRAAA